MKSIAIILKATDRLVTLRRVQEEEDLYAEFAKGKHTFRDMTGKGNPPARQGLRFSDICVNSKGDWEIAEGWTDPTVSLELAGLRRRIVSLTLQRDKATAMGGDYAAVADDIQKDIDAVEAEITKLTP